MDTRTPGTTHLTDAQRVDWLRLIRSDRVGPHPFRSLINHFGSASVAGGTMAVLAGGHDRIYPPEHEDLLAAIIASGGAISEMPLGHVPRARDFPRRNRLISGAALGGVVVEAAHRSGSLITARIAAEQGREGFAVT